MVTVEDVKVLRRKKDSTSLQKWETYWFEVKMTSPFLHKIHTLGIVKQEGLFIFFKKHCSTLKNAKQHIADCLNQGEKILQI